MCTNTDALGTVTRRGAAFRAALGVGLWPIVLADPIAQCLTSTSWSSAVNALAFIALAAVAYFGIGLPVAASVPRWERWTAAATAAAVIADIAVRAPSLHNDLSPTDALVPALVIVLAAVSLSDRRNHLPDRTQLLKWPLGEGDWQIVEGSGRLLNHHWAVPAQRGALDIVGHARDGRSSHPLFPTRLGDYPIYQVPVLSPADGTVIALRDGAPDHPSTQSHPAGNHVVIDTGEERIVLAHLTPGSIKPTLGDTLQRGQLVGLVGSSGNSTEPHLHIHAVRNGEPLTLVFQDAPGPHRRGALVRPRPA
jgi:murein DD-endopeptidase MepM/ murein hydrolase activator NlpD